MEPNYRCCVSCRRLAPKAEFWRVVRRHGDRSVHLDTGMGRSAYLCPQEGCLRQAQRKNRLGRSLKAPVPEAVYHTLWGRIQTSTAGDVPARSQADP